MVSNRRKTAKRDILCAKECKLAFIPTVNAIKISIIGSLAGQQVVLDLTIGTPTSPSVSDLQDAADAVDTWLQTDLLPELTTAYSVNEIKAYDLSSSSAPVYSKPVTINGAVSAPSVTNGTALVASLRTAGRGRSARGRNYVPGLPNNIGTTTATTSGKAAGIGAAYSNIPTYLGPLGMDLVVDSLYTGGAARSSGFKQPVTSVIINLDYDSQRRRLAGRGI